MKNMIKKPEHRLTAKKKAKRPRPTTMEVAQAIVKRLFKRYGVNPETAKKFEGKGNHYPVKNITFMARDPFFVAVVEVEGGKRPYTGSAIRNPEDVNRPEAGAALALRRALLDAMRSLKLIKKFAA